MLCIHTYIPSKYVRYVNSKFYYRCACLHISYTSLFTPDQCDDDKKWWDIWDGKLGLNKYERYHVFTHDI